MIPMEAGNDPVKKALNNLVKAMYGKMDYSDGEEEMGEGEIEEAMDPGMEMDSGMESADSYDPIAEGDAEPQASMEEEEGDGFKNEISNFFNPKPKGPAPKSMTMISVSAKPKGKKKSRGKSYRNKKQ